MITDADVDFHPTDPKCHDWAETNYFAFFNAEQRICGHLQALFRPNLGVVMTDVRIWRGLVDRSWDAFYVANHHHQPAGPSLRAYTLASGLTVEALSARDYRDADGHGLFLYGAAIAGGPWPVYPSVDVGISLMRWTHGHAVGHGLAMENSAMAYRVRHGIAARR